MSSSVLINNSVIKLSSKIPPHRKRALTLPCEIWHLRFTVANKLAVFAPPGKHKSFYPHDAMRARVLAIDLCLHVCVYLSVTRRYCVKTVARIEVVFGTQTSSTYPTLRFN